MTLVIGIGNADRGDDAVGLAVARRVREAIAPGPGIAPDDTTPPIGTPPPDAPTVGIPPADAQSADAPPAGAPPPDAPTVGIPPADAPPAGAVPADTPSADTPLPDVTVTELDGDQLGLLDAWAGAGDVYVIDAVCSGGTPGTVYRFDAVLLGPRFRRPGSHTFSLADVVELARALGRMPDRLVGYGIEGASFALGTPLSPAAAAAVEAVTTLLLDELKSDQKNEPKNEPDIGQKGDG